ncbi:hypothetical protein EGQ24_05475 [bacterium]|nr:hypothetical protein [bacterium]
MGMVSNIVCKTVGIAGMSAVLYDSYSVAKKNSIRVAQMDNADHFEKVHASTRTLSSESSVNSAMQKKVAEMRMDNPLFSIMGNIKGFTKGFLNTLGNNLIPVAFSALALATKGTMSKIGAWGVAGYGLFTIAKEGFGLDKQTPMD